MQTEKSRQFKPDCPVPLLVYGLDAGSYEYNVNNLNGDVFSGTFTLAEDNRFPSIEETPIFAIEVTTDSL